MARLMGLLYLTPLLLGLSGCVGSSQAWVELKGQRYEVELAMDDAARMRGLMFRDQMAANHGMLFVFEQQGPQSFWMRNTRIPLDIIYFDSALRLVSVAVGAAPCTTQNCPSYPSKGPARFVLELNAGHARRLDLQPGDELTLSPAIHSQLDPPAQASISAP